mgnify:CR=1 FL=1
MLCNVSFGILAFSPLGWVLMLIVILLEGFLLALFLPNASGKSHYVTSLVANAVSGAAGFAVSMSVTGGWWLVIWVPWVTSAEASLEQWPYLAGFMMVAYFGSVAIECLVAATLLRGVTFSRILGTQALVNLTSSLLLLGVFWSVGGVPGYGPG